MSSIDLTGKAAFVTGSAGGMGAACARKFAEAGAAVALADLQGDKVAQQAESISKDTGGKCISFPLDVSKWDDVESAVAKAAAEFGRLDIMVNCAGIGMRKPFDEFTQGDVDRIFDINAKGVWYGCVAAGKVMVKQRSGVIINFASIAVRLGVPHLTVYAGSKAAVCAFTQGLGRELAPHGVRVCAVLPGHVRTPMMEKDLELWTNHGTEEEKAACFAELVAQEGIPLGHPQQPEDVADTVLFLASDMASNITAQIVSIDGGCTISY
ncbi:MAG: glucose 1-dehydrogenase [Clostridiales Family XIII bacterium]|jgi:meso-butanediol dehydrogenase/(S,S)-butanediol dehydrogenase/diacetyl reductase|nr:glucose 1-dehydrogenase [Clostridiales Family XIII bacterium]